jgi:hypothetical protein
MVLSVKLDSASVRSAPVPLRTAVAEAAAASLPTRSSERPIDSEDRELLRFSHSVDQAVHAPLVSARSAIHSLANVRREASRSMLSAP